MPLCKIQKILTHILLFWKKNAAALSKKECSPYEQYHQLAAMQNTKLNQTN